MRAKQRMHARSGSPSHAVVLVHGVLGQGFVYWNLVKRYLSTDLFHFHEVRLPFFGFGDLRKSAAHLAGEVERFLAECAVQDGQDKVDIIAHSAGGLVARHYLKFLGGDRRAHSLVTLGTPHQGTLTGALFPLNQVARQVLPGSEFLHALNRGPDTTLPVHYTSIYSPTDGVVVPARNARLPGAHNVEVKFLTHWGFLWDRQVYQVIRDAIDHPPGTYPHYGEMPPRARASRRKGARRSGV